ncbi:MAG: BamA/TamA family outer membrane protein [Spirulina sp. SIO3F2]|nr:BamA/TamA family outer membrane protein [Spirulina sp. SIO3F2]
MPTRSPEPELDWVVQKAEKTTVASIPTVTESIAEPVIESIAPVDSPAASPVVEMEPELELAVEPVAETPDAKLSKLKAIAAIPVADLGSEPVPEATVAVLDSPTSIPVAPEAKAAIETTSPAQTLGTVVAATPSPTAYDLPSATLNLPEAINPPATPLKHAEVELAQSIFDTPPPTAPPTNEAQVLIAEVAVEGPGLTPELENLVYNTIETRPGQTTTRSQLQEDVNAVYATGFFADVTQVPEDTALGVRITFQVQVNPVLTRVEAQTLPAETDNEALNQDVIDDIFGDGYGETLNLRDLQLGVVELNDWYQENGYDLAQVIGNPQISPDGIVRLTIAEGIIEDIRVRFIDEEEEFTDGRTRPFIVTREMQLKPGDVFNRSIAQTDLQRVFGLGLFEDVRLAFEPGEDPSKVIVNVDLLEGNTGSIAAGAGVSSASGIFGTVSYQQQNLGGNNQTVAAEVQLGERDLLLDLSFTDPWIAGDPYRTSYTVNAFRRRSISLIFDEGNPEVRLPNGDRPRVIRTGGGINFTRPLAPDPFSRAEWTLSAGFQYQGIRLEDSDGRVTPRDSQNNLLSFTNGGRDTLVNLSFGATRDRRNSPLEPTQGSLLRVGMDQTLPIGSGQILFNRLRGSYSYYIPVDWFNLTKDPEAPQALAFNLQGGTVIGDLPPYEAFSLGGANSVRGYEEGDVGSGRTYLQATAEYRFPIFSFIGGALFMDYATDLGTGDDVPGNPAGVRNKPGDGFGYGLGVRIQSPLGPIRIDYGFNDEGDSRLHFGIGQRF